MSLKNWVKAHYRVIQPTLLASDVARQFLSDTNQPLEPWLVTRTICEMDDLGLLLGPPNSPLTRTRLREVAT